MVLVVWLWVLGVGGLCAGERGGIAGVLRTNTTTHNHPQPLSKNTTNQQNNQTIKGVDPQRLLQGFDWPEFRWRRGELLSQFAGRTLLLGVDDLDVFKGIELKLQAFEKLLAEHPEYVGTLVLVQVG